MEANYEGMQRREKEGLSYKEKCTEFGNKIVSLEEMISPMQKRDHRPTE